jgi:sensor histidine kinase YesM
VFNIKQISFLIGSILLAFVGISQEYNYIHYTNKDGLAGNTVYGVAQDKEGYLFFATENGLSRYDGKEWVTFTVKDGLPDNEILVIFGDSKGRIWMSCFSKSVCYYYKGKIYNASNDSLVERIKVNSVVRKMYEEEDCNLIFLTDVNIFSVSKNGIVKLLLSKSGNSNFHNQNGFSATKNLLGVGSFIFNYDSILTHKNAQCAYIKLSQYDSICNLIPYVKKLKIFHKSKYLLNLKMGSINIWEVQSKNDIFINSSDGTWHISTQKSANEHFLSGVKTAHAFPDNEGTIWFTTLGQGVYKLSSIAVKTYVSPNANNTSNREIFSISQNYDNVIAGASFSKMISVNKISKKKLDFQHYLKYATNNININRATSSTQINNNTTIIGFDSYLLKLHNNQPSFNYEIMPVKSVEKINESKVLVGTKIGTFIINVPTLLPMDTLFTERTTYANYFNHHYYIGTINGLYLVSKDKHQAYLGDLHPALKRRVTCIKITTDGKIYVATADAGIVILKNNKVISVINEDNQLSSNIVKTLHINNNYLWVGTIKGVDKIGLLANKIIAKYSSVDGLPSNIINAIYIDNADTTVWVGSPEGLTSFKENQINSTSICNLVMQKIIVSNNVLKMGSNNYSFEYKDNNIQFQYVGISFRSGQEITYSYKLIGLDDDFKKTQDRILSYPTLLPGNYTLELFATNKFGIKSETISISFFISTPFWKTFWFASVIIILVIFIVYILIKIRFDKAKKIQAEKSLVKQQLADMEQSALQAQMNPHFIFNCLNSIQQFIMVDNKLKANQYLTEFATLIRATLDNSSKKYISIDDEALYLKRYLNLEQLRFGDSFSYEINMDISVDKHDTEIPAMLLQPFVENSLRHGIRLKKTGKGIIKISFVENNNYLICSVIDNGVGREVSAKSKSLQHVEYQSKGMELTTKRINLLNTETVHDTTVEITDLKDEKGIGVGTAVVVKIPLGK